MRIHAKRAASWLVCLGLAGSVVSCRHRTPGSERQAGRALGFDPSPVDVTAFPSDPKVSQRILAMSFSEAAERLGSLSFEARTYFVFSRATEEHEQTSVARATQDSRGNYHVVISTGDNQVEAYGIGEDAYIRTDKGHLRKKARRDAETGAWSELAWSTIQESLALFRSRLRCVDPRPDTAAGRLALRFAMVLAPEGEQGLELQRQPPGLPLPPPSRWRELAKPLDVAGSLWLDAATGVMLRVKVEGRFEIPDRSVRPTQLSLRLEATVSKPGASGPVTAPKSVPEYVRTPPPSDPIGFFRSELGEALPPGGSEHPKDAPPDGRPK